MNTDDSLVTGTKQPPRDPDPENAVLKSIFTLVAVMQRVLDAWRTLAVSEGRLALACVPLLFMSTLALMALCVSLWMVLVVLAGWGLLQATHSPSVALGLLAAIHMMLLIAAWICVRYWLRQATFPRTRAELRALSATVTPPASPPGAQPQPAARHPAQDGARQSSTPS